MYADFGYIDPQVLENQSTGIITYDELDLMTSIGQSGSSLQLIDQPTINMRVLNASEKEKRNP